MNRPASHPILSCQEAGALEKRLLGGDEGKEWPAMLQAECWCSWGRGTTVAMR